MTRRQRINDLTTFAVPEQPALSPGGGEIVYVLRTSGVDADRTVRPLASRRADGRAAAAHARPGRHVAGVVAGRLANRLPAHPPVLRAARWRCAAAGHRRRRRVVSGLSVVGGTAAVALATPTSLGEIVVIELATGEETVRTRHGESEVDLYEREERVFAISDGTEVHGWLVRDPSAAEPQPLLLDIHGGPHNAWSGAADDSHLYHQELAARGWTILLLKPRGSDGYGDEFYGGVHGAWGEADAKDFLEPIDELVGEDLADPNRRR